MPSSTPIRAQSIEVIVEDPDLRPDYLTCKESYWYPFANNRGHTAYLTLNASNPANTFNSAEWRPAIPQAGYYRVSAYIAAHGPTPWCSGDIGTVAHDTTQARYAIHYAYGVSTRSLSQYPLSNQWLELGEYYFTAGSDGYVTLSDLNDEPDFSTTVSMSAVRFTFISATRPKLFFPFIGRANPIVNPPGNVGVLRGQGFDACHLPTVAEMHTWWHQSPYEFYALYLGGAQLASLCTIASASWVSQVHQQGWSFVPTWVGPQAPCTNYTHRMSSDPAVSYQQGRQEAQEASAAAAALGLSGASGGTIIYYDLEAYGFSTSACRAPVSSFMNGWVQRLHELGNLAGGYGTRNSFITDWAAIPNVPDDIWPASWNAETYDPYASVDGITWLQGLWINHQRIRQYAGDHSEHWGGVGIGIDSDVADGTVALPPAGPLTSPTIIPATTIEDAGWLSAEQGWLVAGGRLYSTSNGGIEWRDISPAMIQRAYFLPAGQAWAISAPEGGAARLFHSSDWGATWESLELTLPAEDWRPIQVQFSSPSSGWVVLQKQTSQAFNIGSLMKTDDGGHTWQTLDLPIAAPVRFDTEQDGWLISNTGEITYHTTDGGLTWQQSQASKNAFIPSPVPKNTTLSGGQANGLGWAVTNEGTCSGEKLLPGFTCQLDTSLWLTQDGGLVWDSIPLPAALPSVQ